jgi:hypothetical protein
MIEKNWGLCIIAIVSLAISIVLGQASCVATPLSTTTLTDAQQYCPESDFEVIRVDGGRGIEITSYVGSNNTVNIPPRIQGLPVTIIGDGAFFHYENFISITIPNSVRRIGRNAFAETTLTSINISNSVTTIDDYAFSLTRLRSIMLPNSVTTIGEGAFHLTRLISVTIPNSVTTIGDDAFHGCYSLTTITFEGTTPPTLGTNMFDNNHSNLRIFVPAGRAAVYRAVVNLNDWRNRIHSVGCALPNQTNVCSCQ